MATPESVSSLSLQGRVAVVTGGGTGIGLAITLEFAKAGADVVVASRTLANLEKAAEEVRALGGRCLAVQADISKKADVENMVQRTMDEFGKIDILVNNAGIGSMLHGRTPPWLPDFPEDHWRRIVDTDLHGVFLCSQAASKRMIERKKGSIINISSMAAFLGWANPYGISKAGVVRLTTGLAGDLGPYNIRVNAICPGWVRVPVGAVNTEDEAAGYDSPEVWKAIPLGRIAEPVDIGSLALFLASDAANYVTGQIVRMAGGLGS